MTWTNAFISRALDGIPKDKYHQRVQAELTDHLLELADELEAGGYSPDEAQARALELMGAPEALKPSFQAEWVRRASRAKYCLGKLFQWAFYGVMFNVVIRLITLIISSIVMKSLADQESLLVFFPLFALWFVPGLWFAAHNVNRDFRLFPRIRRRLLIHAASLLVWFLDFTPIFLTFIWPAPDDISLGYFLFCYLPIMLAEGKRYPDYCTAIGIFCIIFPFLYRPRRVSGGESL